MTKAELIKALKDFPDDMEVIAADQYDTWSVVDVIKGKDIFTKENHILFELN